RGGDRPGRGRRGRGDPRRCRARGTDPGAGKRRNLPQHAPRRAHPPAHRRSAVVAASPPGEAPGRRLTRPASVSHRDSWDLRRNGTHLPHRRGLRPAPRRGAPQAHPRVGPHGQESPRRAPGRTRRARPPYPGAAARPPARRRSITLVGADDAGLARQVREATGAHVLFLVTHTDAPWDRDVVLAAVEGEKDYVVVNEAGGLRTYAVTSVRPDPQTR